MAKCRPHPASIVGGAVLGASLAFLLIPESRRLLRRTLRGWVRELLEREDELEDIESEAGATEGGLAATRRWPS
jgi:hypothetical protein